MTRLLATAIVTTSLLTAACATEKLPMDYGQIQSDGSCFSAPNIPFGSIVWIRNNSATKNIKFTVEVATTLTPNDFFPRHHTFDVEAGSRRAMGCSALEKPPQTFTYKITGAQFE